jgi:anti-anti-sigma regulatory factor
VEVIEEILDDISIYRLRGHLDSITSQGLENIFFQAISEGSKRIIVDFNLIIAHYF